MSRHRAVLDLGVTSVGVRDVGVTRGGRRVLDGVSLSAGAGEVLALTGPSGSGKSTLLALLAGLDTPDTGDVLVAGEVVRAHPRDDFGLVLQGYGLVGVLTAAENIAVPLKAAGLSAGEVSDRTAAALADLGLLEVADHLIEELSGGQQQRVALARALAVRPAVLLADEVTAELDVDAQERALALVFEQADAGAVVVLATHDPAVAALADHQVHLRDGVIDTVR